MHDIMIFNISYLNPRWEEYPRESVYVLFGELYARISQIDLQNINIT